MVLNCEQLSHFHDHGYLVVENIIDKDLVLKPLVDEYDRVLGQLFESWQTQGLLKNAAGMETFQERILAAYAAGLDYFQPLDISLPPGDIAPDTPFHTGPAVFNLLSDPGLLDVVEAIIGPEITSNPIQHVRLKPPSTELDGDEIRAHITRTDWHQDRAVTLEEADFTQMVTVWIAITDATEENGCLQVVPNSHHSKMLRHCPSPQLNIPQSQFASEDAVPLPVPAGGAVLFHPQTIHSSLVNNSASVRWSFDLRYNVTGQPTGRSFFPDFVVRSRSKPESVTVDAERWRVLWEETRARLSSQKPVVIHRWSEDTNYCA